MDFKSFSKKELGDWGENLAADYLRTAGLKIMRRNYRCPKGEIDIIACDGECVIFIEVRTRTSGNRGYAEESIAQKKLQRLRTLGAYYLMEQGYREWPMLRYDVVAINIENDKPVINWVKGI